MNKRGYIFIGMSGVGKTTVGRHFARRIQYKFLDSDQLIEDFKRIPLQEVVDGYKDKKDFVKMEGEVLRNLELERTVLSTGGSACYSKESLEYLKHLGSEIIYLDISWDILSRRIKSFSGRGIILFEKDYQTEYWVRKEKYEALASHVIHCDNQSPWKFLNEIIHQVGE